MYMIVCSLSLSHTHQMHGGSIYNLTRYWIYMYLQMELAVDCLVLLVDQLEGMGAITVHEAVAIGDASVTKEEGHL